MSDNKKVIIGIDFGTSGISFASKSNENKNVIEGYLEDQIKNSKIPTEIILDEELKKVIAFGTECEIYISQNDPKKYHHFKQIKMNLYNNKKYTIKSNNQQKEIDIEYIIQKILEKMIEKSLEEIKKTNLSITVKDCIFVISVPTFWDCENKQIMLKAFKKALTELFEDIKDPSIFFSFEPEAASIYYNTEINNYKDVIDSDCGFILCDLGGGTADIITQKKVMINKKIHFEELYHPMGGPYGSQKINDEFIEKVIKKLFDEECIENLKKNEYLEWIKFENEVELFKKSYNFTLIENDFKYYSINCGIFQGYYKKNQNIKIENLVNNFNKNCPENWKIRIKKRWNIEFPYNIIDDLMEELLEGIVNYINEIKNKVKIKSLIFSGGASLNPIIVSKIQKKTSFELNYILSHNPETAISMGSVKYICDRNIISIRKAKFTLGSGMSKEWNEKLHKNGGKQRFDIFNKKLYCDNLFDKFITKDEDIPSNKIIQKIYFMDSPSIIIDLYKTEKENVTFYDEKENGKNVTQKIGEFTIEVKDGFDQFKNKVSVDMKIGGTFIEISAIYEKTGKKVNANFDCLKIKK